MNGMENMHVLIHAWANLCVCVEPALGLFDLQRTSTVHLNIGFNYSPTPMLWLNIICVMVGRARWRHQLYTHSMIGFLPITVPHTHIIFIRPVSIRVLFFFSSSIGRMHANAFEQRIRLRQESELLSRSSSQHWSQSQSDLQSYASTTNIANDNDAAFVQSSDSLSSTETLKWLGSMSDISSSSHATNTSHLSASGQLLSLVIKIS